MSKDEMITPREAVWALLSHGEWMTTSEMMRGVGGRRAFMTEGIIELIDDHKILMTDAPGSSRSMHHRTTPETRHLLGEEWYVDFQELPWTLKRSLFMKLHALHRRRKGRPSVPPWVRSVMIFEKHLVSMGLSGARPRPDQYFIFPNWWRAAYNPDLKQWMNQRRGDYTFDVCFTEVIPRSWAETVLRDRLPPGDGCYENSDLLCAVTLKGELVVLELNCVAMAQVKKTAPGWIWCPTRKMIMAETARRLQEVARQWDMITPFMPIQICQRFSLLKHQEVRVND